MVELGSQSLCYILYTQNSTLLLHLLWEHSVLHQWTHIKNKLTHSPNRAFFWMGGASGLLNVLISLVSFKSVTHSSISCPTDSHCYNKGYGIIESWKKMGPRRSAYATYMTWYPGGDRGGTGQATCPGSHRHSFQNRIKQQVSWYQIDHFFLLRSLQVFVAIILMPGVRLH